MIMWIPVDSEHFPVSRYSPSRQMLDILSHFAYLPVGTSPHAVDNINA